MKNFLILHYGFQKPTSEDMTAWNQWFKSIADILVDRGGLRDGRKITQSGTSDLSFCNRYTIIEANDLDGAEKIAKECPIVDSTRVYEINKG